VFLRYLLDYRDEIEDRVLAGWRAGEVRLVEEQEARGRAAAAAEAAQVELAHIRQFYGVTDDDGR
jgi:hypothetical protein